MSLLCLRPLNLFRTKFALVLLMVLVPLNIVSRCSGVYDSAACDPSMISHGIAVVRESSRFGKPLRAPSCSPSIASCLPLCCLQSMPVAVTLQVGYGTDSKTQAPFW